ncbi:hypothetical protein PG997_002644 [Apiospora hydei]|uniref:Uncharacterized protein n=1 Tax=Apiospora hydei TaxID=1337664 RepID=A0ABR1WWZ2_9PEZI
MQHRRYQEASGHRSSHRDRVHDAQEKEEEQQEHHCFQTGDIKSTTTATGCIKSSRSTSPIDRRHQVSADIRFVLDSDPHQGPSSASPSASKPRRQLMADILLKKGNAVSDKSVFSLTSTTTPEAVQGRNGDNDDAQPVVEAQEQQPPSPSISSRAPTVQEEGSTVSQKQDREEVESVDVPFDDGNFAAPSTSPSTTSSIKPFTKHSATSEENTNIFLLAASTAPPLSSRRPDANSDAMQGQQQKRLRDPKSRRWGEACFRY